MSATTPRADAPSPSATAEACAAALYEQYHRPVYRYCRSRLRSAEEAEDALQSTFLRVFTALRQGVVPECEAAWLYRIAHNVCLSRHLSSARRARVERPHDLATLGDRLATPARERPEELGGLRDALAEMPERLRRVILLREWQGLSYAEIAEALETSVSAVEALIFRGRRHLAQALTSAEEAPAEQLAAA